MIESIFGLLLLVTPFILVFCFKDKKIAFLNVLIIYIAVHIGISIFTQTLHIFSYPVIISIYSIVAVGCVAYYIRNRQPFSFSPSKINLFAIFTITLVLFQLASIHFFYSGVISTTQGFEVVERDRNLYPYFSDEWVGVSFVNHSIRTGELPLVNAIFENIPFINPFVAFYSATAELFLILDLDPVSQFAYVPLISTFLLLLSLYLYLSSILKDRFSPYIAILAAPLIMNGSNLPGLWFHMPFLGGLTLFMLALTAHQLNRGNQFWIASLIALFLYPPLVVFIAPVAIWVLFRSKFDRKILIKFSALFVGAILILFAVLASSFDFKSIYSFITDVAIRTNMLDGIPSYPIWVILPIPILVLGVIGMLSAMKEKRFEIILPLIVGGLLWVFYTYSRIVIIIDHPRTVVITSVFLVLFSSIGFSAVFDALNLKYPGLKKFLLVAVAISFASTLLTYPNMKWVNLMLQVPSDNGISLITPASPVTNYLTADDLRLFEDIKEERFISHPWKGLVIGVATNNYPLESKTSTISNLHYPYSSFVLLGCDEKSDIAIKYKIAFVYTPAFNCPGFTEIGSSSERYYLYKVQ